MFYMAIKCKHSLTDKIKKTYLKAVGLASTKFHIKFNPSETQRSLEKIDSFNKKKCLNKHAYKSLSILIQWMSTLQFNE